MSLAVTQHNFQVGLSEQTYRDLRAEAERAQQPAESLARQAIEHWLEQRRRKAEIDADMAAFAEQYGGTEFDLDKDLEAAGLECLANELERLRPRKRRKNTK